MDTSLADHGGALERGLGFWSALTIGVGTMIGAGIFLLAGTAVERAGPAAILAYVFAGAVCVITAASAAELATGMPTSGGDYYFVSRSLGPAFGAISGIGIWLSLTVAIAFYLVGMGEFLAQLAPLEPDVAAVIGLVVLTLVNLIGAKQSGGTQVVIVVLLTLILGVFVVGAAFSIEGSNLTPFAPLGMGPVLPTTALIFVSFLGFVKIAAVAEEIENPSRNLPMTLIGSVVAVTVLYVLIVAVIAGIFSQREVGAVSDPLTAAARQVFGSAGGRVLLVAGFLATLSSANASILASSRINLAMARDRMFPRWLAAIEPRLLTPYRAILCTSALALACLLLLPNLEELAKIASSLQLYSYAALNVGAVVLRVAGPAWYRPTFRTPGFPVVQGIAALSCLAIIGFSGTVAQLAVLGLILVSLLWFSLWGRTRVQIEHALPRFRVRLRQLGPRALVVPTPVASVAVSQEEPRAGFVAGPTPGRRVVVAVASPGTETSLMELGRWLATGAHEGGAVIGVHLVEVPGQTPLDAARDRLGGQGSVEHRIADVKGPEGDDPMRDTTVRAITDVTHDVVTGLMTVSGTEAADLMVLGWRGGFSVGSIYNSPVQRLLADAQTDVAVLKDRGLSGIDRIIVPWGGGVHARLGLELAVRVARAADAQVELLRIVRPGTDLPRERRALERVVEQLVDNLADVHVEISEHDSVADGLQDRVQQTGASLVIIGASLESRIRNVLFGSVPDLVAERAACSVLMVHRHVPGHWSEGFSLRLKRIRAALHIGTSPDETP